MLNNSLSHFQHLSSSALEAAFTSNCRQFSPRGIIDLVRLLSHDVELQDPFEGAALDYRWTKYTGDAETLAWILQAPNSSFQERSVEDCVLFAMDVSFNAHLQEMAHIVRTVLKEKEIDEQICSIRNQTQYTLLHYAAFNLGALNTVYEGWWNEEHGGLEEIFSLIADLVNGGSSLHALTSFGRTPMLEIWHLFVSYKPLERLNIAFEALAKAAEKVGGGPGRVRRGGKTNISRCRRQSQRSSGIFNF
jgi:hypothetical protein